MTQPGESVVPPAPSRNRVSLETGGDRDALLAAAREVGRFDADTAVQPRGAGVFDVYLDPRWNGFGPNGGYIGAVLLRAMATELGDTEHRPRSLTVHYARPCAPGPATVEVTVLRRGRTVCSLEARLRQQDSVCTVALGAFIPPGGGPEFADVPLPDMPAPETIPAYGFDPRFMPNFAAAWESRPAGPVPFAGVAEAHFFGWLRLAERRRADALSLTAMADALAPSITARMDAPTHIMPTVDLTVHFPNPVPAGLAPDEQLAVRFRSHIASAGVVVEDGWIWTRSGLLVAQARQLAVLVEVRPGVAG